MKLMSLLWKIVAHWKGAYASCQVVIAKQVVDDLTYPMQSLACGAMTVFGSQRLLSAKLILDFPTVALRIPYCFEVWVVVVDFIWLSMLPLVFLAVCGISCLMLMLAGVSFLASMLFACFILCSFLGRHRGEGRIDMQLTTMDRIQGGSERPSGEYTIELGGNFGRK